MRVISLACSNTEIICALGAADELVGVDDHSDFPREVVARVTAEQIKTPQDLVRRLAPRFEVIFDASACKLPLP